MNCLRHPSFRLSTARSASRCGWDGISDAGSSTATDDMGKADASEGKIFGLLGGSPDLRHFCSASKSKIARLDERFVTSEGRCICFEEESGKASVWFPCLRLGCLCWIRLSLCTSFHNTLMRVRTLPSECSPLICGGQGS